MFTAFIWSRAYSEISKSALACLNKSRYIALFVVSVSIKNLFLTDCVNIYLFSIFFSIDYFWWKNVRFPTLLISWFINFNQETAETNISHLKNDLKCLTISFNNTMNHPLGFPLDERVPFLVDIYQSETSIWSSRVNSLVFLKVSFQNLQTNP